jgi:uncharacterized protein (DUF1778 family)
MISRRVYSQRRNKGEIVFDILKLFRRGTIISLEMPTETLRLIERAAAVQGCSVNEFIIEAAMRRAREILAGQNVASAENRERDALDSIDVVNCDIKEKRRVWVGRKPLSLDEANQLVRDAREQRDRQNTGEPDR